MVDAGEKEDDPGLKRIPCPYDPAHSVFVKDLEKHMKKCNAKPGPAPLYYTENINILGQLDAISPKLEEDQDQQGDGEKPTGESVAFKGMQPEDFHVLVKRLEQISVDLGIPTVSDEMTDMAEERVKIGDALKEQMQKDALIEVITGNTEFRGNKTAVVEMGCGKGGLSHHLAISNPSRLENCRMYLVDRDNFKGKFDNKAAEACSGLEICRARIDIKDLNLDNLVDPAVEHLVVISKHLCGAATDLTLAALESFKIKRPDSHIQMFVALCCHQRCTHNTFAGQHLFQEPLFMTKQEFSRMCGMSSWAVCGWRYAASSENQPKKNVHYSGYTYDECTAIGYMCKRILNEGRLKYIRENIGLDCTLVPYIGPEITLENQLLMTK